MKKKLFLSFILLFIITITTSVMCETVCYEKKSLGGCYEWDSRIEACPLAGYTCEKTVTQSSKIATVTHDDYGYYITTQLADNIIHLKILDLIPRYINRAGENYPFGLNEYLHIVSSDEYPDLDGLDISLSGMATNNYGYYTVFVP